MKKTTDGNQSWWDKLFNFSTSIIESLMSVVFIILGWLASTIEWWAYILQSAILFIGYALSPIFIGMLAFPSLQNVGRNYLLNLLGIMTVSYTHLDVYKRQGEGHRIGKSARD